MTHIKFLPYYLLKEIVRYEYKLDLLDLICFSLSCRHFFYNKEKYLVFNPKEIIARDFNELERFSLHSYRSIFEKTIQLRKELGLCRAMVCKNNEDVESNSYAKLYYDHSIPFDHLFNLDNRLVDTNQLQFSYPAFNIMPDLTHLNIKEIYFCASGFITEENDFEQRQLLIPPNSLPYTIKDLTITVKLARQSMAVPGVFYEGLTTMFLVEVDYIQPHLLPSTLTKLDLYIYNQPLEPGTLPSSLTALGLLDSDYNHRLQNLPPSLTSLHLGFQNQIKPNQLPLPSLSEALPRLISINYLHYPLLQHIPKVSLKSLSFAQHNLQGTIVENLPPTLTNLNFGYLEDFELDKNSIPSSVIKLNLSGYKGAINGVSLSCTLDGDGADHNIALDADVDANVDEVISTSATENRVNILPPNLKELNVGKSSTLKCSITKNILPKSLEVLKFPSFSELPPEGQLNAVLEDYLKDNRYRDDPKNKVLEIWFENRDNEANIRTLPNGINNYRLNYVTRVRRIDKNQILIFGDRFEGGFQNI